MKRNSCKYIFGVLIFLGFVLLSCDKNESIESKYDSFDLIERVRFGGDASEQTITFTTSQKWAIDFSSETDWYTISPNKGEAGLNEITVAVSENNSDKMRNGSFSIKSGEVAHNIQVSQDFNEHLSVNEDEIHFSNSEGEQSIHFSTNKDWEAVLSDPQNHWCELIPSVGEAGTVEVTVKVKKNTGPARQETLSITSGKKFKTITIFQEENKLVLKLTNNTYPNWEDCQPYVEQEFGEGWIVADWEDILLLDDPRAWAQENGMKDGDCFKITFNGESAIWGNGYYIAYFPNGLPEGQGSSADYDCFFVGSWNMNLKVVAKKVD